MRGSQGASMWLTKHEMKLFVNSLGAAIADRGHEQKERQINYVHSASLAYEDGIVSRW